MDEDPIVAEVRAVREKLAEECDYDLLKNLEIIQQMKLPPGSRIVTAPLKPVIAPVVFPNQEAAAPIHQPNL